MVECDLESVVSELDAHFTAEGFDGGFDGWVYSRGKRGARTRVLTEQEIYAEAPERAKAK